MKSKIAVVVGMAAGALMGCGTDPTAMGEVEPDFIVFTSPIKLDTVQLYSTVEDVLDIGVEVQSAGRLAESAGLQYTIRSVWVLSGVGDTWKPAVSESEGHLAAGVRLGPATAWFDALSETCRGKCRIVAHSPRYPMVFDLDVASSRIGVDGRRYLTGLVSRRIGVNFDTQQCTPEQMWEQWPLPCTLLEG